MEEKAKSVAELLKLLANENRLLILCGLEHQALSVKEIHTFTPNISLSALSQHLGQLKLCGILESEKKGMQVTYQIADNRILALLDVLKAHYC